MKWVKTHPDESKDFKATENWFSRFMKKKDLVFWQKTKIAQKLPADLEESNKEEDSKDFKVDVRTS